MAEPCASTSFDRIVGLIESLDSTTEALCGDGCDVSMLDEAQLRVIVRAVRSSQRTLEQILTRVASAADALDGSGHGVLLGDGQAVAGRTARRELERALLIQELPAVGEAVGFGRIGGEQLDLLVRAARDVGPECHDALSASDLIKAAASEPVDSFARRLRGIVDLLKGDHGRGDALARPKASSWRSWFDHRTGMGHMHGTFDPERHEAIQNSLEAHLTRLANESGLEKNPNLAAAAAFELLTQSEHGGPGRRHIGVVVDWETFVCGGHADSVRETVDGRPLPPETISRIACDAVIQRIVLDQRGVPVNVGRRYRTATDAQWQAARAVHRTCAWYGCDRPLAWCQLHHIHEWEHGGPTDLCNLVPLCGEHHHAVHEGGWSLTFWEDRTLDIHRPDGTGWVSSRPDRVAEPMYSAVWPKRRSEDIRVVAATHRTRCGPKQPAGP